MATIQGVSTIQGIQSISFMPVDAVERYVVMTGISGTEETAIRTLASYLKSIGAWDFITAMYPVPNAVQASCQVNLKNPGTYDLTFFGGWTFASTGMTPNGSTGYADTGLNPSGILGDNDAHMGLYSRTNSPSVSNIIGVSGGSSADFYISLSNASGGIMGAAIGDQQTGWFDTTNKFIFSTRTNATHLKLFSNGVEVDSNTSANTKSMPSFNIFLGAINFGGSANNFGSVEIAFAMVGAGISDAMAADIYTGIQAYQTTLSRQV